MRESVNPTLFFMEYLDVFRLNKGLTKFYLYDILITIKERGI